MVKQISYHGWTYIGAAVKRHYFNVEGQGPDQVVISLCGRHQAAPSIGPQLRISYPTTLRNCQSCEEKRLTLQPNE